MRLHAASLYLRRLPRHTNHLWSHPGDASGPTSPGFVTYGYLKPWIRRANCSLYNHVHVLVASYERMHPSCIHMCQTRLSYALNLCCWEWERRGHTSKKLEWGGTGKRIRITCSSRMTFFHTPFLCEPSVPRMGEESSLTALSTQQPCGLPWRPHKPLP